MMIAVPLVEFDERDRHALVQLALVELDGAPAHPAAMAAPARDKPARHLATQLCERPLPHGASGSQGSSTNMLLIAFLLVLRPSRHHSFSSQKAQESLNLPSIRTWRTPSIPSCFARMVSPS